MQDVSQCGVLPERWQQPCLLPIGGQKQARLTPASSLFVLLASAFKDVIRLYYEIRRDLAKCCGYEGTWILNERENSIQIAL